LLSNTVMVDFGEYIETLNIVDAVDVAYAALAVRKYAEKHGFSANSRYMISSAVSELSNNIIDHADRGTISWRLLKVDSKVGIEVVVEDSGPGIKDIGKAMQEGYSTGGTLGLGLPGARRLMDYFEIDTVIEGGTKITVRKWI
jgi:serine/threonine-protein kinase RsbT